MSRVTVTQLLDMKRRGEKIACLTAYDASFARLLDDAGVDVLLVGDSLGMVIQGAETTIGVRLSDMIYHSRHVRRGARRALLVTDMPFMSYASPHQALGNAARIMAEGGAEVIKLEGGATLTETVELLSMSGIPVCGHLGLLPQSIHKLGGYRVQGRTREGADRMLSDARTLEDAGAVMLVLECVPRALASEIRASVSIPVIGIGAGADCDGQVLVLYDMLGISGRSLKFSKNFLSEFPEVRGAVEAYVQAVKAGRFPRPEHGFEA